MTKKQATSELMHIPRGGVPAALAAKFAPKLAATAHAALGTSLWPYLGTKGAIFRLGETKIGSKMELVILDYVLVNQYYEGEYNPQQSTPPTCYAISTSKAADAREKMAPPESLATRVSVSCSVCPMNAWGSGKRRGKACKNGARLTVLGGGEDFAKTAGARLSVPVTSVKKLGEYLTAQAKRGRPHDSVLTEVTLTAGEDGGFDMSFSWASDINNIPVLDAIEKRAEQGHESLVVAPNTEARVPDGAGAKGGGKKRVVKRKITVLK